MLSLHTNFASMSTQSSLGGTQKALTTSMTRLGTGYRINSAMDDAAGLQIATRMNAQSSGMTVAMRNTQNGISMMQTAEGAFKEMTNILIRMKDLATESATASSTATDRTALQAEFDALGAEVGNIIKSTTFAGEGLFEADGAANATAAAAGKFGASMTFQIGSSATETMDLDLSTSQGDLKTALNGLSAKYATGIDGTAGAEIDTLAGANGMITDINDAIDLIGETRAQLGATSNRLESVYNNLSNMRTQVDSAKGRIMDVDYSSETAKMTKQQMLMQASTSMLKQSNSMSQMVLSLMQ